MFGRWRWIVDGLRALAPAHIRMNHAALDGPRPHNGDLNYEVVEFLRLHARQHAHLRTAFDLEDANGVSLLEHLINAGMFLRDCSQRELLFVSLSVFMDEVERLAETGK